MLFLRFSGAADLKGHEGTEFGPLDALPPFNWAL
jgi:hypothetical protein